MRKILILVMLLVGCDHPWTVWRCEKGGDQCQRGSAFDTKDNCEMFVKKANEAQPNVTRMCVQTVSSWRE